MTAGEARSAKAQAKREARANVAAAAAAMRESAKVLKGHEKQFNSLVRAHTKAKAAHDKVAA